MKSSEPLGKVKTIWTRLIKPTSMIQAVHMWKYTNNFFYQGFAFLSNMRFCHAKSFYTLRNGYCCGILLLKINWWTFPRYLLLCWILNISWCFHHRPCMLPWTWTTILYIKAQYKCTCATVCNLIVILTAYMHIGGKRDEIWLNIIIILTGHLNMLRHLRYHVFHMCKC